VLENIFRNSREN
jgi:recombinational DNA repair protein RecR